MSEESTYRIIAEFKGSATIIKEFRTIRAEAERTTRSIREGARAEQQAVSEAKRREAQATREAMRATKEAQRAEREMYRWKERLRREDLTAHRRYMQQLRQEQSDLERGRSRMGRVAGAGAAGLGVTALGVKIASDFEAAVTDLRLAIQRTGKDGAIDLALLNDQMGRFEQLGIRLGNQLPGTTEDFIQLFAALRKGGIDAETILKGAGEAASYLAVITEQTPKELAVPFAQMGQMLELKGEDYVRAADLFARLYRTVGLSPDMLIESAKYFQPRAGSVLGLSGFEGLTTNAELIGLLKRQGLEGSIAGTQIATLVGRLTFHRRQQKKELADLKREGISLDFFDKQGRFAGVENFITQMGKLNSLSQERKLKAYTILFGQEARGAADVFARTGVEGFRKFQAELKAVPPLQSQINELQETFRNKLEATLGSAENVVARGFLPMLNTLKPFLDGANQLLGSMEAFTRDNPEFAKWATGLMGITSAALLVGGSLGFARRSLALWQVTGRLAAAENVALASSLGLVSTQSATAATAAQVVQNRWTAAIGVAKSLRAGLLIGGGLYILEELIRAKLVSAQALQDAEQAGRDLGESVREGLKKELSGMTQDAIQEMRKLRAPQEAKLRVKSLRLDRGIREVDSQEVPDILSALAAFRFGADEAYNRGYGYAPTAAKGPEATRSYLVEALRNSQIRTVEDMKATLEEVRNSLTRGGSADLIPAFEELARGVFPGLYAAASEQIKQESELAQATGNVTQEMRRLKEAIGMLYPQLPGAGSFQFGKPQLGRKPFDFSQFHYATGGVAMTPQIASIAERGPEIVLPISAMKNMGNVSPAFHFALSVDARGSNDPAEVEAAVRRAGNQLQAGLKPLVLSILKEEFRDRALSF